MKATQQPTLIIMAAGMGSRYGGLKQVDKITDAGEIILDFSLYDAMMAGFNRAVFVIKEENRPCGAGVQSADQRPVCGHQC